MKIVLEKLKQYAFVA